MAAFETFGFDELLEDLKSLEIECPDCGQTFSIQLDDLPGSVTCPHCGIEIQVENENS